MERIGALIHRLLEQYENNAGNDSLQLTAQMLLNELQNINNNTETGSKKVAVILPAVMRVEIGEQSIKQEESKTAVLRKEKTPAAEESLEEKIIDEEIIPKRTVEKSASVRESKKSSDYNMEDIPTFAYQQKNAFELNDAMSQNEESLNDRLKVERTELGHLLKESPVKDLRKAIGINDRFAFINELFRGDENMYERSIKTINSFTALAEAEFWIQRELKTKIGWNEGSETVHHFDQLVRRRFS
jgi:hypothetical protein